MSDERQRRCPICEEPLPEPPEDTSRPFCSKRCKQLDLGKWFGGEYAIAGEPAHPDDVERHRDR